MKSLYVKPEVKVVITELESMFASSAASDTVNFNTGNVNSTDKDASDARGNRGTWGDLWN